MGKNGYLYESLLVWVVLNALHLFITPDTMTFDNTHWLHKKKLFYVAEILEGDGGNCTDVSSGSN